jgi:hypothetical protein
MVEISINGAHETRVAVVPSGTDIYTETHYRYRYIGVPGATALPDPSVLQPSDELHLVRCQKQQRGTSCAHPGCATNPVDIVTGSGRSCELHYPVHVGQVQSPRCHVLQSE